MNNINNNSNNDNDNDNPRFVHPRLVHLRFVPRAAVPSCNSDDDSNSYRHRWLRSPAALRAPAPLPPETPGRPTNQLKTRMRSHPDVNAAFYHDVDQSDLY